MVTERVAIWDFFILYSGETFCDFVKKQGKTFRVFVKKCIIGESKHCAGGLSWNHSIIPK